MIFVRFSGSVAGIGARVCIASLLLGLGCSAPPGAADGDDQGVPEFEGTLPPPSGSSGMPAVNPGITGATATPTAPGSSSNEQVGSGIGLQPAANGQGAGAGSGAGAGAGGGPGESAGPAPGAMGSAGSTSMPAAGEETPQEQPAEPPQEQPQAPSQQQPEPPAQQPPVAGCDGAFVCDGFEGVAAGSSPSSASWTIIESFGETAQSASVLVSAENARSGSQALRIEASQVRNGIRARLPQSSYFVRAFFQLDSVPLGPVFIGAGVDQGGETRFRIQGQSFATINTVPGDPVRPATANGGGCPECVTLTPSEWFCAEMFIDDAAQTATLWIDGVEAAVAGPDAFFDQPAQPFVFIGSWGLQGGQTGVWIDDVVVGPERIGCD